MSAEILRRAAALMRERAEAAPAGERWVESDNAVWRVNNPANTSADALTHRLPIWADGAAEHIASWHPDVALEVADLLDVVAEALEDDYRVPQFIETRALAAARAYLGEES